MNLWIALGLLGAVSSADNVQLRYLRGELETCPDAAWIRTHVAAQLGYDPFRVDAERFVDVHLERLEGSAISARIELLDARGERLGERTLSGDAGSCEELAQAIVFAISVAIDPLASSRPPPEPVKIIEAAPPIDPPAHVELALAGTIFGSAGMTPRPTLGFSFGARGDVEKFGLELEARFDLPARVDLRARRGAGAFVLLAQLAACFRPSIFSVCGVASAGVLEAKGDALEQSRSVTSLAAAAGLRAELVLPLSPSWAVEVRGELLFALARTRLLVGEEEVWRSPPLSAALGAGPVLTF